MMNNKIFAGAIATGAAVVGILSAGSAEADVPAFTTPFVDPGCLCAVLLPRAPAIVSPPPNGDLVPGEMIESIVPDSYVDIVAYWHIPATEQDWTVEQLVARGSGRPIPADSVIDTYHGHESVTLNFLAADGTVGRARIFESGDRIISLETATRNAEDLQGHFDALTSSFQFL